MANWWPFTGAAGSHPEHGARVRAQAVTAAGQRIEVGDPGQVRLVKRREQWQRDCWDMYDVIGEVKYGTNYLANVMSRLSLFVGVRPERADQDPEPLEEKAQGDDRKAMDALARLSASDGSHAEILRELAISMMVPGEAYLYGRTEDNAEVWDVRSTDEVSVTTQGQIRVKDSPDQTDAQARLVGDKDFLCRIWHRHPRWSALADSPLRGALSSCEEILLAEQATRSTMRSRMNAGLLLVPEELTPKGPPDETRNEPQEDELLAAIIKATVTPIQDEGDASAVAPMVMRGKADYLEKVRHITFNRELDALIDERMERGIKRLAQGLNIPAEILTGMGDVNHWCKPVSTQAFTSRGWVDGDAVRIGDEVLTLDHTTGHAAWSRVRDIYVAGVDACAMIEATVSGPRGAAYTLTSTEGHRFPVLRDGQRIVVTGDTLQVGDVLTRGAHAPDPGGQAMSDDMVRLLAWYSADGTLTTNQHGSPGQIRIGKSWRRNPQAVQRLVSALTGVFGPPADEMPHGAGPMWRMEHQDRGMAVAVFNAAARDVLLDLVPGKDKVIPVALVDKMTAAQREMFLDAWMNSDGTARRRHDTSAGEIWQRVAQRLDAAEYAAILSGRAVRRAQHERESGFKGIGTMYQLVISSQPHVTVRAISRTTYTGRIWCPVTDTGTWLARDPEGWTDYTGNSAWQIDESAFKRHGEPLAIMLCNALTIAYLHPMLKAAGMDPGRYIIWFDPTLAISRRVEPEDAFKAHEAFVISDEALRATAGFSEDDAPDEAEIAARVERQKTLRPVQPKQAEDAEPVQEGPPADDEPEEASLTAAAANLGERMLSIDRGLRLRIQAACDERMRSVLAKAGAAIRSKARGDASVSTAIGNVSNDRVASTLGPSMVATLGLDPNDLVAGGFDDLNSRVLGWCSTASKAGAELVPGLDDPSALLTQLEGLATEAWEWLRAELERLAVERLYEPDMEPEKLGESDGALVPYGVIREAVARAGGAHLAPLTAALSLVTMALALGLVTGFLFRQTFREYGVATQAWKWVYGAFPRDNPFEPHRRLDGKSFQNFDDEVLRNTAGWPSDSHYIPGDHKGCVCDAQPIMVDVALAASARSAA